MPFAGPFLELQIFFEEVNAICWPLPELQIFFEVVKAICVYLRPINSFWNMRSWSGIRLAYTGSNRSVWAVGPPP